MKDRLKEFVSEHRDEFDAFEPRPELWQDICQELPASRKEAKVINIRFGERASFSADFIFMRVAAAIVLLLACGITLFTMKHIAAEATGNTLAAASEKRLYRIAPEIAEAEVHYVNEIREKKSELSAYDQKVLGLDGTAAIDRELATLDSSYTELKKQLYTSPNTDRVVEAMVRNLQIRLEVLNRQLEVLQKIERKQQQPDATENETSI